MDAEEGVCSVFQRYNLKAIHNPRRRNPIVHRGVLSISKIQSESNSQRNYINTIGKIWCAQYFKDTI